MRNNSNHGDSNMRRLGIPDKRPLINVILRDCMYLGKNNKPLPNSTT